MRLLTLWLFLVLLASTSQAGAARDQNCVRLSIDTVEDKGTRAIRHFLTELYQRAGYCLELVGVAPTRSIKLFQEGSIDGFTGYAGGAKSSFPSSLVYFDKPILVMTTPMLWLRRSGFNGTKADLKGRVVALERGANPTEERLASLGAYPLGVTDASRIVDLLLARRVDVYLSDGVDVEKVANNLDQLGIAYDTGVWRVSDVYLGFHRRHAHKLPRLQEVLEEMKLEGALKDLGALPGLSPVK